MSLCTVQSLMRQLTGPAAFTLQFGTSLKCSDIDPDNFPLGEKFLLLTAEDA